MTRTLRLTGRAWAPALRRKTLFVTLVKTDGPTALDALRGYEQAFSPLDATVRKTLTCDQGKEITRRWPRARV